MATGVIVEQRAIEYIGEPIELLRIGKIRHNRIRADKPPQPRRIIAGIVIAQAEAGLEPLPGEAVVGRPGRPAGPALPPERQVAGFGEDGVGAVGC